MSFVGSELNLSIDTSKHPIVSDDELSSQAADHHPPPSPPNPVEMLFLNDLSTQNISAAALAQQIHETHRRSPSNWTSTTDDFATAAGSASESVASADNSSDEARFFMSPVPTSSHSSDTPFTDNPDNDSEFIFSKDVLTRDYSAPAPDQEEYFQESTMARSKTSKASKMNSTSSSTGPKKFIPSEPPMSVDAADKVYGKAKDVWSWGKSVGVLKPFLGLAEGAAGNVVGMTGNSLTKVDGVVVEKIHELDSHILNPAISTIVGIILGAAGKTEDFVKPIVVALLKPLGLIKETAENPETNAEVNPEITAVA